MWRFAISATFTAEPVEAVIRFWGRRLNVGLEAVFAPYNQPIQTLLDPQSVFARNSHGVNVLLLRLEDLGQFHPGSPETLPRLEENIRQLVATIRAASENLLVPLVVILCPASPAFLEMAGAREFCRRMTPWMAANLGRSPGLQFIGHEEIARLYPVADPHNPQGERLGRIPYIDLYFAALGTMMVRHAHALLSPPYKVIALDCDNTLWQGICGEDGPTGVQLDAPRRALQEFMLEQREAGMILCLASKNNEQDVFDTFAQNPSMPLQLRHFVAWRLDWRPKADGLSELAEELGLGLDSFIFVDDNPKECAEVENALPEVLSLALPADVAQTEHFLRHVWAFDHPVVTEEDRRRSAFYQQAQEFGRQLRSALDLSGFYSSLQLRVALETLRPERLPRAAQLTQRTNQFNTTTIRRTETELQALLADTSRLCCTVEVSDRFGEYGVVGVVTGQAAGDSLLVDSFLLSCRVLGRGVEYRVLAWLAEQAEARGLQWLDVRFAPTRRNQPARDFLEAVAANQPGAVRHAGGYRLPVAGVKNLEWKPSAAPALPVEKAPSRSTGSRKAAPPFARLAQELSTPAAILAAVRREAVADAATAAPAGSFRSESERKLAAIWAELLERPSIAPQDNFFDLGGHSLLAVLLLVRVEETFGVELSIDDVYTAGMTLESLAARIDALHYSRLHPDEYESLRREIEAMTDEEVRAELLRAGIQPGEL